MPRMDGLQLLKALREQDPDITVVILTAQGTVESAVEAIKDGAYDYLTKPVDPQRLQILLDKVVERQETLREVKALRRQLRDQGSFGRMIGSSPGMRKVYRVIEQAAPTSASVLINGESGTGKELVAQTIHQLSPRGDRAVRRHQLRGDSRDAARERDLRPREGRVHRRRRPAPGLLRAGRPRHALPRRDRRDDAGHAGEAAARAAGADASAAWAAARSRRWTCASSRRPTCDPAEAVRKGKLREDLYYRLNVFAHHAAAAARSARTTCRCWCRRSSPSSTRATASRLPRVNNEAMRILERLRLARQRARAAQRDRAGDDPGRRPVHRAAAPAGRAGAGGRDAAARRWQLAPGTTVEEAERRLIQMTLEHTRDNKTRAAEILGISLKTLHNKLNKLKLQEVGPEHSPCASAIKAKQIGGVSLIVGLAIVALSAHLPLDAGPRSASRRARRARTCWWRPSSSARARSCPGRPTPTRRCAGDGGLRSILESSAYSKTVDLRRDRRPGRRGRRRTRCPTARGRSLPPAAAPRRRAVAAAPAGRLVARLLVREPDAGGPPAAAPGRRGSSGRSASGSRRCWSGRSCARR